MADYNLGRAFEASLSDTVDESAEFSWVMATDAPGDIVVVTNAGTAETIANVPINVWVPCGNCKRINSTGTTPANILVV